MAQVLQKIEEIINNLSDEKKKRILYSYSFLLSYLFE